MAPLGLLLAACLLAPVKPATVELTGKFTVADALDRAGHQLNRKLVRWWTQDPKMQAQVDFALHGATLREALRVFEQALGVAATRSGRFVYAFGNQSAERRLLGEQTVDGWRLFVNSLDVQRDAVVLPGLPDPVERTARQQLVVAAVAPNDLEQVALADAAVTQLDLAPGQPLRCQPPLCDSNPYHDGTHLTLLLDPWDEAATELSRLTLDLTFAELSETSFDFANVTGTTEQALTVDGLTATLRPHGGGRNFELLLGGYPDRELPEGPAHALDEAYRAGRLEARGYDAAGQPLLTVTTRHWTERRGDGGASVEHAAIDVQEAQAVKPARLTLRALRRTGQTRHRSVTFEHLPLPPRRGAA